MGARPAADKVASIAVLPFANRSASPDDEYFSDGLADELLSVLSKIKGLRVTARTSSFQFKGSKEDVPTIGRKLDVATLLEGSVRKAGNRIRVSVQLVNVADTLAPVVGRHGRLSRQAGRQAHDKRAYEAYASRAERAFLTVLCILGDS